MAQLPSAPVAEAALPDQSAVKTSQINYDEVGYARIDQGLEGVTIASSALPIDSFAEVTALANGRTILAMVAAPGPVTTGSIATISSAAAAQLGLTESDAGVRIRRTNPPEHERTALKSGGQARERLETPPALLSALRKRLGAPPAVAAVSVAKPVTPTRVVAAPPMRAGATYTAPDAASAVADAKAAAPLPPPVPAVSPPSAPQPSARPAENRVASSSSQPHWKIDDRSPNVPRTAPQPSGSWYVQVGAFANAANARATASRAGGGVSQAGSLYRVRTGPYPTEAAARAALGPLAAKGYRGARITR